MGKSNDSSPPPAPDPYRTAQAQTGSNVNTAVANAIIGNANEVNPWGSVTYRQIGSTRIGGDGGGGGSVSLPGTFGGKMAGLFGPGKGGGEPGYDIPQYERVVTLSPEQQRLYDQQTQLGSSLNQFALDQTARLRDVLGRPINADGLPQMGAMPSGVPTLQQLGPEFRTTVGPTDYSEDRRRVEEALLSRINPQLDRDREALETRLINQGFARGTDAFQNELDAANRQATDARMQAVLAGGQEQSRLAGLDFQKFGLENAANLQRTGFNNEMLQRTFGNQINLAQMQDTQRERALQERLALRNQPLNEISALMSGGQVTPPQFAQYRAPTVAGTDISGMIYNSNAIQQQQYQQEQARQQSQQNAMLGGLFSLGSAAMLGPLGGMFGGARSLGGMGLGLGTGRLY